MAKVTGPLMSMEASGSVGDTLTFSRWAGRAYVRRYVVPANPQTADQMETRNIFSAMGKATLWAGATTQQDSNIGERDADAIAAIAPSDQRWNGYATSVMAQTGGAAYQAAQTAWGNLDPTDQDSWDSAADGLTPPMQPAPQLGEGGASETALTNGNVFFIWRYALFTMGIIDSAPSTTPPSYSTP